MEMLLTENSINIFIKYSAETVYQHNKKGTGVNISRHPDRRLINAGVKYNSFVVISFVFNSFVFDSFELL